MATSFVAPFPPQPVYRRCFAASTPSSELGFQFDYVIVDSAPVLAVADSLQTAGFPASRIELLLRDPRGTAAQAPPARCAACSSACPRRPRGPRPSAARWTDARRTWRAPSAAGRGRRG